MDSNQTTLSLFQDFVFSAQKINNFPFIVFDSSFIICDSNEKFWKEVRISDSDLQAFHITNYKQNIPFVECLKKVAIDGLCVFSGTLFLSNAQYYEFDKCVCVLNSLQNGDYRIVCVFTTGIRPIQDINFSLDTFKKHDKKQPSLPAISIHASDGRLVYLSESIQQLLGYTYDELIQGNPYTPVYPDDRNLVKDTLHKLESGEKSVITRYRMLHKDGQIIEVETSSYKIDDIDKKTSNIVNVTIDITGHSEMQERLNQSEEKYHKLIMSMPVGIVLIDPKGFLLEVNDALRKMMGLEMQATLPDFNFLSYKPMQESGAAENFLQCLKTRQIVNGEIDYAIHGPSSRQVYLKYSFIPFFNHDGHIKAVIGNVLDLSDLREAELENKRQAEFLNLVVNSMNSPFFVKDENHKWVILNDAFLKLVGRKREEIIGKSDFDIFPENQAKVFWEMDNKVITEGSSSNEEDITNFDSTIRKLLTYKNLYHEKSTGKKYIVGFSYDITELKKVENELRRSVQKYQLLFENASDLILVIDLDGKIIDANKKALSYIGQSKDSLLGMQIKEYVHVDDLPKLEIVKEKIFQGSEIAPIEIRAYNAEGKQFAYEVKVSLVYEDNAIAGFQAIFSDITQRYEANRKLEKYTYELKELNATKDKFFSIIAHDLRSPYSSIIGFAELLIEEMDTMTKSEVVDYVKIIRNSAKNSFNLLENLLTWSRLEMDRLPCEPTNENLKDSVNEVLSVLYSLSLRKRISIENFIASEIQVFADKNMLNTILHNLIMNAIKFTPIDGKISITAKIGIKENSKWAYISICDTGVGMDAKTIEEVLSSPRPASRLGTEREPGTGLGLILTREMVERHGGKITIQSEINKGSVFTFMIPVTSI